jgi:sialic acid synthase SpsE
VARFIAEIGSNHNRERKRCLALVDAAAAVGCEAVKLQVFRVGDLFAPEALARHPELSTRSAWEFPLELLEPIRERCDEHGMLLGATPFAPWAVEALVHRVDFFKIASYDLLRHDLIGMCAATGKPIIVSTGMATLAEVAAAVACAGTAEVRLLHCVSGYPTPPEQANLAAIATLCKRFGVPVGWSDHTNSELVVRRAVTRWHASDVEVHIDLDGGGYEAGGHSWTPERLRTLIAVLCATDVGHTCPEGEDARLDGDGVKRPMPVERPDVPWRADPTDGLRPLRALRRELVRVEPDARR